MATTLGQLPASTPVIVISKDTLNIGQVDNTPDTQKPLSIPQNAALAAALSAERTAGGTLKQKVIDANDGNTFANIPQTAIAGLTAQLNTIFSILASLQVVAPVWTTLLTQTTPEGAVKDIPLVTDVTSTFTIVGGADQALFSIVNGNVLRLAAKSFASPTDANTDNQYVVTVRATRVSNTSLTADRTITVGVTAVAVVGSSALAFASSTPLTNLTLPTTAGFFIQPYVAGIVQQLGGINITQTVQGNGIFDDTGTIQPTVTFTNGTPVTSATYNNGVVIDPLTGQGVTYSMPLSAGVSYTFYIPIKTEGCKVTCVVSLADNSAAQVTQVVDSVNSSGAVSSLLAFTCTPTNNTTFQAQCVQSTIYNTGVGNSHYIGCWLTSTGTGTGGGTGGGGSGTITYSTTQLTISQGGTYSGYNLQSNARGTPCIRVTTSQPVIITGNRFKGKGSPVDTTAVNGANVTFTNNIWTCANPDVSESDFARFLELGFCQNLLVQYNTAYSGTGIYSNGGGQSSAVGGIRVKNNLYYNVEGRNSGGVGTYSTNQQSRQFLQLNQCVCPGADIGWNQVVNTSQQSRPEDNISMHDARGTATNPINIHDNFIFGGYPIPLSGGYSGGGIIVDGSNTTESDISQYITIQDNVVCATTNYGVAISTGHHNQLLRNRVVISGKVGGTTIPAANVGCYAYAANAGRPFHDIVVSGNAVGCNNGSGNRNDYYIPSSSVVQTGNTSIAGSITEALEQIEVQNWANKLSANSQTVGATIQ